MEQERRRVVYIYGLKAHPEDVIQYVGYTTDTAKRLKTHKSARSVSGRFEEWAKGLEQKDAILMEILEETTEDLAGERENFYIHQCLEVNPNLLNVNHDRISPVYKKNGDMVRFQMFSPSLQLQKLKKLAKDTGLSIAEHIRRAIDAYLRRVK